MTGEEEELGTTGRESCGETQVPFLLFVFYVGDGKKLD